MPSQPDMETFKWTCSRKKMILLPFLLRFTQFRMGERQKYCLSQPRQGHLHQSTYCTLYHQRQTVATRQRFLQG